VSRYIKAGAQATVSVGVRGCTVRCVFAGAIQTAARSGRFSVEAGTRAAAPFLAPLSPLAASFLRCAPHRFSLDEAEHFPAQSRSQRRYAPMVFGIIPECRAASLRNERSASPESPARLINPVEGVDPRGSDRRVCIHFCHCRTLASPRFPRLHGVLESYKCESRDLRRWRCSP